MNADNASVTISWPSGYDKVPEPPPKKRSKLRDLAKVFQRWRR